MNLIDFLMMVHVDNESFIDETRVIVEDLKAGSLPFICLDDDQAVFVDGKAVSFIQGT